MAVVWPSKNNFANGDVLTASNMNNIADTLNVFNPTSATNGQVWTANGSGSGSYASIASALKIMKPTSVAVGGGTATINADGSVSFTNATGDKSFNGVFDSTCRNYLIIFNLLYNAAVTEILRWRVAGVDSSSSYQNQRIVATGTTLTTAQSSGSGVFIASTNNSTTDPTVTNVWVYSPAVAARTYSRAFSQAEISIAQTYDNAGFHNQATAYDGFTMVGAATINGLVTIYGMDQ